MRDLQVADLRCGHCGRRLRGYGSVFGDVVCRPERGLDCYRLVTVYGHELPCEPCKLHVSFWAERGVETVMWVP